MKKITIIMPFLNEDNEPIETVKSIYETANSSLFDIIAIDDGSVKPINFGSFKDVKCLRNDNRIGVDGCRQLGANMTETPYFFILDAHMRFKNDNWLEKMIDALEREPETAWCTVCLGLGYGTMNVNESKGKYYGATMLFVDPNAQLSRPAREVLEPKWADRKEGVEYELPCILGANYGFSKKWFDYIGGLKGLQMWGTSEPFLSLKTWMAGGKCKIKTDIEIGHKFRDNAPYRTGVYYLVYNKIFLCKTILPEDLGNKLINYLPKDSSFYNAMKEIENNQAKIISDKDYYQSIFKYSIDDYCKRFNIKLPE